MCMFAMSCRELAVIDMVRATKSVLPSGVYPSATPDATLNTYSFLYVLQADNLWRARAGRLWRVSFGHKRLSEPQLNPA